MAQEAAVVRERRGRFVLVFGLLLLGACSASDAVEPRAHANPEIPTDTLPPPSASSCMRTDTGDSVCSSANASAWQLVSVGGDHTCALKVSGDAYCWGSNRDGQLGASNVSTACTIAGAPVSCGLAPSPAHVGTRYVSISAGGRHTCAIVTDGRVDCWGADDFAQSSGATAANATTDDAGARAAWTQISSGSRHTCAVRSDGAVFCWGANDRGQLGDGTTTARSTPNRVSLPAPAASVSAGDSKTCARTLSNVAFCWGALWTNRDSTGLEMARIQPTPVVVPDAPSFGTLSVGGFTTCGTSPAGVPYCWDANPRGEMGVGTSDGSTTPLHVMNVTTLSHMSAGLLQSCGVAPDGTAYCWGDDSFGQLGVDPLTLIERCDRQSLACSRTPIAVSGGLRFVQVSAGPGSHTCGVTTTGLVACWGLGVSGQRGDGTTAAVVSTPTLVISR